MSWIAVSDGHSALRSPGPTCEPLLATGTLQVEVPIARIAGGRAPLVQLSTRSEWPFEISLTLSETGRVTYRHLQGFTDLHVTAALTAPDPQDTVRVTLSWHAPQRVGVLTAESLLTGQTAQTVFENPLPWQREAVSQLISDREASRHPDLTGLAVSRDVAPHGLRGGLAGHTMIETAAGPRRIDTLARGDLIPTANHGLQPLRRAISVAVPSVGLQRPVPLKAPFFGLTRDLTVAADHRLLMGGAEPEYLFGSEAVLLAAHHLEGVAAAHLPNRPPVMRYWHLLFEHHVCVQAGGAWCESLYVGDLVDHPGRCATSVLGPLAPCDLPRHQQTAGAPLKGYEAAVLISAICA